MKSTRLSDQIKLVLGQTHKPLSAYVIADLLTSETGRKHFANSVYRVLNDLLARGDVLKVISVNGWLLRDANLAAPVILAVCSRCIETRQVQIADIDQMITDLAGLADFRVSVLHLEVLGVCDDCAGVNAELLGHRETLECSHPTESPPAAA
jgi:Fur family zinc uptake transcriptional regulator